MTSSTTTGQPDPMALFDVSSVAVVGASPGRHYSTSVLANLRQFGLSTEQVMAVNPKYDEIDGHACFASIADLPAPPSLVVSLVGVDRVDAVLADTINAGVKAMLVIADGYSEMGAEGTARQAALAEKAARGGVALLGPNSLGYVAPSRHVAAWVGGKVPSRLTPGRVSLAFQSSGMLNLVLNQVANRKIGLAAAVSVGNEAVMDLADFIGAFADDPDTDVLGIVLESTTRPRALAQALLHAYASDKTVVVLSIGKSERGMKNVSSHAGRMATSGRVWSALFRQVGALLVDDLTDFMETIALSAGLSAEARGGGLALATISGGDCGLLSDMAENLDLELSEVTPETQAILDEQLSRTNILANPLDVRNTRTSAPDVFWASLAALAADPNIATVALRLNLALAPTVQHEEMYKQVVEHIRTNGAECVFMSRVTETSSDRWFDLFAELGTPFLTSYDGALKAFANLQHMQQGARFVNADGGFTALPESVAEMPETAALSWRETMDWVEQTRVPFTRTVQAMSTAEAVSAAGALRFPLAAKGIVPGVAHKSELKLVELGIADAADLEGRVEALFGRMADIATQPGSGPVSVEIQEMAADGAEFFLGMHSDPILGRIMSFGLGGIFLELLHDVVYAVPPVTSAQATALLQTLRGWDLLQGARGQEPHDVAALADVIARVSAAVAEPESTIRSFDLNPVLVMAAGNGVVGVDAYVERTIAPPTSEGVRE
ncbi:acetate--CoA ligase family protein [Streptomyces sp. NPDC059909]|uniref:acetate--CoA ligase family protein n=1 Tax=Streptomyces sp. NPDC059909 TaxID=3346998 RepID=UPI0036519ECD